MQPAEIAPEPQPCQGFRLQCTALWLLCSKPLCTLQVPARPKVGGSSGYWPARHSGARAVLLLLYREHLVSAGYTWSRELRQRGVRLLQRLAQALTDPALVTES